MMERTSSKCEFEEVRSTCSINLLEIKKLRFTCFLDIKTALIPWIVWFNENISQNKTNYHEREGADNRR